jgi:hypothetical protein
LACLPHRPCSSLRSSHRSCTRSTHRRRCTVGCCRTSPMRTDRARPSRLPSLRQRRPLSRQGRRSHPCRPCPSPRLRRQPLSDRFRRRTRRATPPPTRNEEGALLTPRSVRDAVGRGHPAGARTPSLGPRPSRPTLQQETRPAPNTLESRRSSFVVYVY